MCFHAVACRRHGAVRLSAGSRAGARAKCTAAPPPPHGTVQNYQPVTNDMLLHPSPDDWLMYSRTYDAWRYSPLKQINTKTVKNLRMVWALGLPQGVTETIPIVHNGVMYTIVPGGDVMAIDATNGNIIWEYV